MSSPADLTFTVQLADMTVDELVQLSQGLGHQIERLRRQRAYLGGKIAERLEAAQAQQRDGQDPA
jgi:hypothetical protein